MANNRWSNRDPRTGRWARVPVENAQPQSKFDIVRDLEVGFQGADPADSPYELVPGDRNVVQRPVAPRVQDNLGVGGSPLRARRPTMVHPEEQAREESSRIHNAIMRSAARDGGPMDPSYYLTHGAE